jgi:hypothetical protein
MTSQPRIFSDAPMRGGTCIWCLNPAGDIANEHIIPESMGGPFVLPGTVVCGSCNAKLSRLDRAVSDPFDFMTFHAGVLGKRGRMKKVNSRGNIVAEHRKDGSVIRVNSGRRTVTTPDGQTLSGAGQSPRNVMSTMTKLDDGFVKGNLSIPFFFDRMATRGILKIALEAVAFQLGDEFVLQPKFNAVRDYVLGDIGNRSALMLKSNDLQYRHELDAPTLTPALETNIRFRLAIVDFVVDLTETEQLTSRLVTEARQALGENGWHLIPDKIKG